MFLFFFFSYLEYFVLLLQVKHTLRNKRQNYRENAASAARNDTRFQRWLTEATKKAFLLAKFNPFHQPSSRSVQASLERQAGTISPRTAPDAPLRFSSRELSFPRRSSFGGGASAVMLAYSLDQANIVTDMGDAKEGAVTEPARASVGRKENKAMLWLLQQEAARKRAGFDSVHQRVVPLLFSLVESGKVTCTPTHPSV